MKPVGVALMLLLLVVPLLASGQQSDSARLPLVITDKEAVEEWSRSIYDSQLDPDWPSDTAFLLTLSETEWLGRFRFRQRCALCHGYQANRSAETWGPVLTQENVVGRDEAVRQRIMEGSVGMPSFRYALDSVTIDAIIAYLKKVEEAP
jgi:hypothetical protein